MVRGLVDYYPVVPRHIPPLLGKLNPPTPVVMKRNKQPAFFHVQEIPTIVHIAADVTSDERFSIPIRGIVGIFQKSSSGFVVHVVSLVGVFRCVHINQYRDYIAYVKHVSEES